MLNAKHNSRHLLLWAILFFLFTGIVSAQQKPTAIRCNAVTFKFSLKAGESFQKAIGNLTFKVQSGTAQERPNGWTFSLDNADGQDFIAPVSIPLRFNPSQILGPGYGLSARDSLKNNRELPFLISDSDYELIVPLWRNALWSYSAPDPDHAADNYVGALGRIPLGMLRLKILQADVSPEDLIRSASFEIEFTTPAQFHFDPSLSPRPSSCPQRV